MIISILTMHLLTACDGSGSEPCDEDPNCNSDTATEEPAESTDLGPPPTYSGEACPELVEGTNDDFLSGGELRSFELVLPDNPDGAGLLFSWHWLGGSGAMSLLAMQTDEQALDAGHIVVAPESCCSTWEWLYTQGPDDNVDLILFDDIRACLYEQYAIDLNRVWSYGMSAGGMWTSYLSLHRSEELAASAPLSGGSDAWSYSAPTRALPMLLTWGGPSDTYGTYSFDTASQYLSEQLQAEGSFVIECVHDEGHTIPKEANDYLWPFLEDHPRGVEPLPYAGGLSSPFPSWCEAL